MNDQSDDSKNRQGSELQAGTMVSHYEIIKQIGVGGMGEVYLARDTKLNRQVALKFLSSHFIPDEDFKKRFIREAEATARLNHPNIVTIYEVGEYPKTPKPHLSDKYIQLLIIFT